MKRCISLFCALSMAAVGGCAPENKTSSDEKTALYGENYRAELEYPEPGRLQGMCYLAFEGEGNGIDHKKAYEL